MTAMDCLGNCQTGKSPGPWRKVKETPRRFETTKGRPDRLEGKTRPVGREDQTGWKGRPDRLEGKTRPVGVLMLKSMFGQCEACEVHVRLFEVHVEPLQGWKYNYGGWKLCIRGRF